MAGARLRAPSTTQAMLVLSLLLLLLPPLHGARRPTPASSMKPDAASTAGEEGQGRRLAPARPLRILAEPVPARRKAGMSNGWDGSHGTPVSPGRG
ncbi:hypothetical protein ACP70R_029827 [Stipagrostis hirtigluma subsp. patula]